MRPRLPQLLICDDDSLFHLAVKHALKGQFDCKSSYNGDEAITILRNEAVDVVLLDVQMRTPDEGLRYLPKIKAAEPDAAIVMSSGATAFDIVREAMRLGASDYVPKDFDPNDLMHTLANVLETRSLKRRREQQNFEALSTQRKHLLLGESPAIQHLRKTIERIKLSPANVLIQGETGTGKEVVARLLRKTLSDGALEPFVAVDSSTIQSSTAESHLFGHEKGAFTGAERSTKGIFEEANGGIVYFDEVANMPPDIQAKLLRVLQEKEITRLGSCKTLQLDFRVICATNKNLDELAQKGLFKDDLLQRINVIPIELPPLRERKEDIPLLLQHFVQKNRAEIEFTEEAIALLQAYSWPGNVRELGNVVAYTLAMCASPEIDISDLPPKIREASKNSNKTQPTSGQTQGESFYDRVASFERQILAEGYEQNEGNISRLALALGMDRSHLYTKLKEHGLHPRKK